MKSNLKFFKNSQTLPVDEFFKNVLYDKKIGYYNSKQPFGRSGDYITAPNISRLFSEMIAIWVISTWESIGKPKNLNLIELGPGDGSLTKVLIDVFERFPEFNNTMNIYLYEISNFLKKKQKNNINNNKVKWISNFKEIKKGPVIFFANEFFDAIPIKQFKRKNNSLVEKYYILEKNLKIKEKFVKASKADIKIIGSFKTLKNLRFIEFPKSGLKILENIIKIISKSEGFFLMIDYGYIKPNNQNTLQSVINHKKNDILDNLGKADITSHVNFSLLKEFFEKNHLKVKKTITQKEFLENMGIIHRAQIIAKKMKFSDQSNLYLRLKRLLSSKSMGNLFKVILAHNNKDKKIFGFN